MVLYKSREEAGKKLANKLSHYKFIKPVILAIPRGGVPVGYQVAKKLKTKFDILIPRKIPIPWNTEAGFGAVAPDGTIILNKEIAPYLGLNKDEIKSLASKVFQEIKRREKIYRGDKYFPDLRSKTVILVDDGIASGITMLAAVQFIRKKKPLKIIVATPVASGGAVKMIEPEVDQLICLHKEPENVSFAVASFYEIWTEMTNEEVINYLRKK